MSSYDVRFTGDRRTDAMNLARQERISVQAAGEKLAARFDGNSDCKRPDGIFGGRINGSRPAPGTVPKPGTPGGPKPEEM